MGLAATIQISDQDVYQQSANAGSELLGQVGSTSSGNTFVYSTAGGTLTAGQITQTAAVTANYATRTLSVTATTAGSNQISVPLGTTAAADVFKGFWFVVTDGTGKGQGVYYITGNTAATAGNSNTTLVNIRGTLNIALDNTSVVGLYPNQSGLVVQHTASSALPTAGVPIINVTNTNYFWNQTGGYASVLSDGIVTKNAMAIPSASVAGAVTIDLAATVTGAVGYAPEATVDTKYSPLVLTLNT